MQVTVGCLLHANLTALQAGGQRSLDRARYREMESDAHHTGEITMLHPSLGIAANILHRRSRDNHEHVTVKEGRRHGWHLPRRVRP